MYNLLNFSIFLNNQPCFARNFRTNWARNARLVPFKRSFQDLSNRHRFFVNPLKNNWITTCQTWPILWGFWTFFQAIEVSHFSRVSLVLLGTFERLKLKIPDWSLFKGFLKILVSVINFCVNLLTNVTSFDLSNMSNIPPPPPFFTVWFLLKMHLWILTSVNEALYVYLFICSGSGRWTGKSPVKHRTVGLLLACLCLSIYLFSNQATQVSSHASKDLNQVSQASNLPFHSP